MISKTIINGIDYLKLLCITEDKQSTGNENIQFFAKECKVFTSEYEMNNFIKPIRNKIKNLIGRY